MKSRLLIIPAILVLLLAVACGGPTEEPASLTPRSSNAGTPDTADSESPALIEIGPTRTPGPTATPDRISREVTELVESTGLGDFSFLGLTADNWINLGVSLLIILIAYVVGILITRLVISAVVRRSSPEWGESIADSIGPRLKWLIVVPAFYLATIRLDFLNSNVKIFLGDVYFVMGLVLVTLIVLSLIDLAHAIYRQQVIDEGRDEQLRPVLQLIRRIARIVAIIVAGSILFSHFGINFTALVAALGIGGLALSLAAQDTLADAISGFIILADQPYRVGDRIEIQGEGTWGDVVEIGLRTTRIRTRDNRMVIVPNSIISKNQVVNYTFPDPQYRIQTHLGVAYGTDVDRARRTIVDAVRGVEGILPDKPVDALYNERGDSSMIFRVRWWIESYEDTRRIIDRVNSALEVALNAAGIDAPFPTQNFVLQLDPETAGQLRAQGPGTASSG
jgi:MscS family membrane protein